MSFVVCRKFLSVVVMKKSINIIFVPGRKSPRWEEIAEHIYNWFDQVVL